MRGIVVRVDDSHYLRRFTRIHEGQMMGPGYAATVWEYTEGDAPR